MIAYSALTRTEAVVHANVWLIKKKTSDGSKILVIVLQSHFKHGGQNTSTQNCKGKNRYCKTANDSVHDIIAFSVRGLSLFYPVRYNPIGEVRSFPMV